MLELYYSHQFKKDFKKAKKQKKDVSKLKLVISKLAFQQRLDSKYHDHTLVGTYTGYHECHIEPDWLLIYKIDGKKLILVLTRLGSHSELFNK